MATIKSKIGRVIIPLLPVNRRTFDILRYELQALVTTTSNFLNPLTLRQSRELKRSRDLSINIASGGDGLPGWSISNFSARKTLRYPSIFDGNCRSLTTPRSEFSLSTVLRISILEKTSPVFFDNFIES